jgi:hypothetical protein
MSEPNEPEGLSSQNRDELYHLIEAHLIPDSQRGDTW